MQSIKSQIKTFFNFNKRQERGAFVLIVLIIIAFAIDLFLPLIIKEEVYDYSADLEEIEEWKASAVESIQAKIYLANSEKLNSDKAERISLNPVPFNPNNLPEEKWIAMGMPSRIVTIILNYEDKGGSFKKAEDLLKIYGLSLDIYKQLETYIIIPRLESFEKNNEKAIIEDVDKMEEIIPLDINRADSAEFLNVPGIGHFYAGQIVDYRRRLGGYLALEQLNDLYKMDSIRLNGWLPYLSYTAIVLNKIDLNTADFKSILKHPYIDYETTKKILNHRNKLGRYAALYQLKRDSILSDSLFKKLEPYLKVD